MSRLLINRWQTPDGTILESIHVHDFVQHTDKNGEYYFIDGGIEYCRMSVNDEPMKDLCLYTDSDFEEIRKYLKRGTFTESGDRIWIPLCNMSNMHLKNSIAYNKGLLGEGKLPGKISLQYLKELDYRWENKIWLDKKKYTNQDATPLASNQYKKLTPIDTTSPNDPNIDKLDPYEVLLTFYEYVDSEVSSCDLKMIIVIKKLVELIENVVNN